MDKCPETAVCGCCFLKYKYVGSTGEPHHYRHARDWPKSELNGEVTGTNIILFFTIGNYLRLMTLMMRTGVFR